ncbi:agamous-like MADS-box protein AGL104 [Vitis riparia]|uniref:agamous-like MADS-box protein AGL104 n=1 Tax=Vitis riparia TaxID=96939 RepID=UPI00155B3E8B|nr:agamous-like MADS-box protein AGL104 [Vitis riparia]
MGRGKQEMRRIEDKATRQVSFSRRKKGLIKKAYELSVLCGIDIALIMFSPSGRLTQFSGKKRIEEVLTRYMNLTDEEREEGGDVNSQIKELQREVDRLQQQLQTAEEQLREFEPQSLDFKSMGEIESMEERLVHTLEHVLQRKEYLSGNHLFPYDSSSSQGMLASFENQVINGLPAPSMPHGDLLCTTHYPLLQGSSSRMRERCVNNPTPGNLPMWPPASSFLFPPIQHEVGGPEYGRGADPS